MLRYTVLSMGEPAGTSPEVMLKTLSELSSIAGVGIIAVGDEGVVRKTSADLNLELPFSAYVDSMEALEKAERLNENFIFYVSSSINMERFEYGVVSAETGRAVFESLKTSIDIIQNGLGHTLVTSPVSGKALEAAGYKERTVNDMLRRFASSDRLKSMIRAGNINIFGLTHRCAIRTAITSVTRENIISSLIDIDSLFVSSFFDKSKPIAVSSLNPLLPGNGWTGPDEDNAIIPAIEIVRKLGINAVGPIAPEFLFERAAEGEFSAILVMAATEGLAAASAAAPGGAFFLTWGLPFIRVGTISDIGLEHAGKGIARIDKFVASVHAGLDLREADALA